jgi:hypothetical protein
MTPECAQDLLNGWLTIVLFINNFFPPVDLKYSDLRSLHLWNIFAIIQQGPWVNTTNFHPYSSTKVHQLLCFLVQTLIHSLSVSVFVAKCNLVH